MESEIEWVRRVVAIEKPLDGRLSRPYLRFARRFNIEILHPGKLIHEDLGFAPKYRPTIWNWVVEQPCKLLRF
jgi:hypothetical protein